MKQNVETFLSAWGNWSIKNKWKTIGIALAITLILGIGIGRLRMEMTFFSIMPESSPKVADLKEIMADFPSASSIFIVVEGDDSQDIKNAVDDISTELSQPKYSKYVKTVRGQLNTKQIEKQLLYMTAGDTDESMDFSNILKGDSLEILKELNKSIAKTLTKPKEELTPAEKQKIREQLSAFDKIIKSTGNEESMKEGLKDFLRSSFIPESYFINDNEDMAIIFVLPTFTINDFLTLADSVAAIESGAKQFEKKYNVKIGLTGLTVVGKDEAVTSEQGIVLSSLLAFALIIFLLIFNFRMKSVPLLAGIPLLTGIVWTVGMAGFLLGRLNIMTAMYMVALLGLGIDFGIHLLTAFLQEREKGNIFTDSITEGIKKSGRGIMVGGITTAIAFFALLTSKSELIEELAIVAGIGILCELAAMFILMPALLAFRNSRIEKKHKHDRALTRQSKIHITEALGIAVNKRPFSFFILFIILAILLSFFSPEVKIETNLMNMEAKGLESIELQNRMVEKFGMSPDGLNIVSNSLEETRELTKALKNLDLISEVDSVSEFIPKLEDQQKLQKQIIMQIEEFNKQTELSYNLSPEAYFDISKEFTRLNNNLNKLASFVSMPDISGFQKRLSTILDSPERAMTFEAELFPIFFDWIEDQLKTDFITPSTLSDDMKQTYFNNDFSTNLITIIPKKNLWEEENRLALYEQLQPVTDKATGMIIVSDQMSQIAKKDGVSAALAAVAAIFLILVFDFRNIKLAFITLLPLAASLFSLLGFMAIFDIKFDFVNIIAVPLLLGIGIDDAIHISHRFRLDGSSRIDTVIDKIGRAIIMTTLTTIIGFASFIPSIMRAMRSTGIVLSIAMFFALVFSLFMHSALLKILSDRLKINFEPWGIKK